MVPASQDHISHGMQPPSLDNQLHPWGCPPAQNENGVKSRIQTDPCDYKGHTHRDRHTMYTYLFALLRVNGYCCSLAGSAHIRPTCDLASFCQRPKWYTTKGTPGFPTFSFYCLFLLCRLLLLLLSCDCPPSCPVAIFSASPAISCVANGLSSLLPPFQLWPGS